MPWKKKTAPQAKDKHEQKHTQRRKAVIPVAFREQIWLRTMGRVYEGKCPVTWCQNKITVHDFQSGHNIPESKGGKTSLDNLIPICSRCNLSMGNRYSIDDWNKLGKSVPPFAQTVEVVEPSNKFWCC